MFSTSYISGWLDKYFKPDCNLWMFPYNGRPLLYHYLREVVVIWHITIVIMTHWNPIRHRHCWVRVYMGGKVRLTYTVIYMQLNLCITQYFFSKYSLKTLHSSLVRARYGCILWVHSPIYILHVISFYDRPCYNDVLWYMAEYFCL